MNKRLKMYEGVIDEFAIQFPHLADKIVGWCPNSRYEVCINLENGDEVIYDFYSKMMRTYKGNNNGEDRYDNEDLWLEEFSRRFSAQMKRRGMTRWRLSRITGISEVSISKYANGKSAPNSFNIRKLAKALECSQSYLTDF